MAGGTLPYLSEGAIFARLKPDQKQRVLDRVGKLAAQRYEIYRTNLRNVFDFRDLGADARLAMYRARTLEEWAAKKSLFPAEYANQIHDFYILERRIKGAQGTVAAAGKEGKTNPYLNGSPNMVV